MAELMTSWPGRSKSTLAWPVTSCAAILDPVSDAAEPGA